MGELEAVKKKEKDNLDNSRLQLRDMLYDLGKFGSGCVNQDQLDTLMILAESMSHRLHGISELFSKSECHKIQDKTFNGFKLVAEDLAEVSTQLVQVSNVVNSLNKRIEYLELLLSKSAVEAS